MKEHIWKSKIIFLEEFGIENEFINVEKYDSGSTAETSVYMDSQICLAVVYAMYILNLREESY